MGLFDFNRDTMPRRWSEMSLEFKLMFAYHIAMMALLVAGDAVPVSGEIAIAAGILAVIVALSWRHRETMGWRWPGAKTGSIVSRRPGDSHGGFLIRLRAATAGA